MASGADLVGRLVGTNFSGGGARVPKGELSTQVTLFFPQFGGATQERGGARPPTAAGDEGTYNSSQAEPIGRRSRDRGGGIVRDEDQG